MTTIKLTTRQKEVLKIYEESKTPLTPQEAWAKTQKKGVEVGLATIYRAIGKLTEVNLLKSIEIADETPRYEAANKPHHHHFFCQNCGKLFDIPKCPPSLTNLVPQGFVLKDHSIMLYGLCDQCAG